MGKKEQFPYVGTTYRLTEHFHTWTKHALLNAIAQPEQFVEISETLAAAKGINNGDRVTVSSKRGFDTIPQFLQAGIKAFGTRAFLTNDLIENKDYQEIENRARKHVEMIKMNS